MVNYNLQWLTTPTNGISLPTADPGGRTGWRHFDTDQAINDLTGVQTDTIFVVPFKGVLHKVKYKVDTVPNESNTVFRFNIIHNSTEIPSSVFSHGPGSAGLNGTLATRILTDPLDVSKAFPFDKGDFINHGLTKTSNPIDPNPGGSNTYSVSLLIEFIASR